MRKAYHNVEYIFHNEEFIGVSLGYDYCAEHEWGIKGIRREFGMESDKIGIEGRAITKGEVTYLEDGAKALIRSVDSYLIYKKESATFQNSIPYELTNSAGQLQTAWDEDGFCIIGDIDKLSLLKEAFDNKNIAFAKMNTGAFGGTALSVLIKDRIPTEVTEQMAYVDNKALDLVKYEAEIGLTKLKEQKYKYYGNKDFDESKHKYWMACSPSWINYKNENPEAKEKNNTEYDIKYWVNYGDNDVYGWFTVEQIKTWLETPNLKLKDLKE